eukprot:2344394-Prymnesium_polylepis.1
MKKREPHDRAESRYSSSTQIRVLGPRGDVHDGSLRRETKRRLGDEISRNLNCVPPRAHPDDRASEA